MLEIDAFNICLEASGLRRISQIDLTDAQTAQIDTIIQREKAQVQYDGYPFNTERTTLTPVSGSIDVSGFLQVELPDGLVVKDDKVFDARNQVNFTDTLTDVWVIFDRTFSDIPEQFQEWIARRSAGRFVSAISGPDDTYQEARIREAQAFSAAHLSQDAQWDPIILSERQRRIRGDRPAWSYGGSGYGSGF